MSRTLKISLSPPLHFRASLYPDRRYWCHCFEQKPVRAWESQYLEHNGSSYKKKLANQDSLWSILYLKDRTFRKWRLIITTTTIITVITILLLLLNRKRWFFILSLTLTCSGVFVLRFVSLLTWVYTQHWLKPPDKAVCICPFMIVLK